MSNLLAAAAAPVLIIAFYIYIRDKYEKEPVKLLLVGLLSGVLIVAPIAQTETLLTGFMPIMGTMGEAFYLSFIVASLSEELFKYAVLFFLVWRNDNFNERFDGIVYAVFISLGFAGLENILYVVNPMLGGMETAISRAVFSVPGHALFGVAMGYYFSLSKFEPENKIRLFLYAFLAPYLLHGVYDFILLSGMPYLMVIFIPFVSYLWITGFRKMAAHLASSPFKLQ